MSNERKPIPLTTQVLAAHWLRRRHWATYPGVERLAELEDDTHVANTVSGVMGVCVVCVWVCVVGVCGWCFGPE